MMNIYNVGLCEGNPLFIEGSHEAIAAVKGLQMAANEEAKRADRLMGELIKTQQALREALVSNGEMK